MSYHPPLRLTVKPVQRIVATKERIALAGQVQTSNDRLVIRPSLLASIINVGLCIAGAIVMVLAATARGNPGGVIIFELALAASGLVLALYLLGERVEVDGSQMVKLYFFGLFRKRIPFTDLEITEHREGSQQGRSHYWVQDFEGSGTTFSMIPFFVWRARDVRAIVERGLANSHRRPGSHVRSGPRCRNPDCVGGVMSEVSDSPRGRLWRCELCGDEELVSAPRSEH